MTDEEIAEEYARTHRYFEPAKREDGTDYAKEVSSVTIKEAHLAGAKSKEKYIEELEKENAELQEQCAILADCDTCFSPCKTENIEIKKQLDKAKELLAKLLEEEKNNMYWEMNGSDKSTYYEVIKQAEQFLRETER